MKYLIQFNGVPSALPIPEDDLKLWLIYVISYYKAEISQLTYNFLSVSELLEINQSHLSHNTYTDIITFNYGSHKRIEADIYLSYDRILENAQVFSESIENETLRVLAHGLLHCIGYNDKSKTQSQKMRSEENRCIELFHVKHKTNV